MTIQFKSFPVRVDTTAGIAVSSEFNRSRYHKTKKKNLPHKGIDLAYPTGTPIQAVDFGTIERVVLNDANAGNFINVKHAGYSVRYLHLSEIESGIQPGVLVDAGEVLGRVGNTGASDGPHLHFELYNEAGVPIDPGPYLRKISSQNIGFAYNGTHTVDSTAPSTTRLVSPSGVSPFVALLDSFHPNIQYELTKRRLGTETVNVHMPFVKLTALLKVKSTNIQGKSARALGTPDDVFELDGYCPTIGVHGNKEVSFDNLYLPVDKRSIVGYATRMGETGPERVGVVVDDNSGDAPNIPPPGITDMTVERSVAGPMGVRGGLFRAHVKITAHSVGQLNALLTYFLRPGTRVVLEMGRMSSSPHEQNQQFFNWTRSESNIREDLEEIVLHGGDQKKLLYNYVFNNYGNYEMLLGYIADFKLKYDSNNRYNIDLTVHSLQQFELPLKNTGTKSLCVSSGVADTTKVIGIDEYFAPSENWKRNTLTKLLAAVAGKPDPKEDKSVTKSRVEDLKAWKSHVVKIADKSPTGGFLVTWKFFIDVILHDSKYGIMSIFSEKNSDERNTLELLRKSLPPKFDPSNLDVVPNGIIDGQVAWHKNLRSVDPSMMVIHNPTAQVNDRVKRDIADSISQKEFILEDGTDVSQQFDVRTQLTRRAEVGAFDEISQGISSLFTGVWLNTKAIAGAFDGIDTLSAALSKLVVGMNTATEGVWNLQVLSDDGFNPGLHIIDMGLSKPNQQPSRRQEDVLISATIDKREEEIAKLRRKDTPDSPNFIYKFNRPLKLFTGTDDTLGSELLSIDIQSGLPHVVAVQALAGVGGLGQRGTLASINVDELKALSMFDTYPTCTSQSLQPSIPSALSWRWGAYISETDASKLALDAFRDAELNSVSRLAKAYVDEESTSVVDSHTRLKNSASQFEVEAAINFELTKLKEEYAQRNGGFTTLAGSYGNSFGRALDLIEWNKSAMIEEIEKTSAGENGSIHSFNSSNLTKTIVELTMPGIGGIQLFQAFEVDRVPNFLNKGYYIVVKLNHDFSTQKGWTTKLTGRFRYKEEGSTSE